MKKIMFAAAMIAATAAVADVTSANTVGYQNLTKTSDFFTSGSMFITPGSNNTYRLYDFHITGATTAATKKSNYIQFMQAGSLKVDSARSYYWDYSKGYWCYKNTDATTGQTKDTKVPEDTTLPSGYGFLCRFPTAGVGLAYAGEVPAVATDTITISKPSSGDQFFFVANPFPVAINIENVKITGATTAATKKSNYIQYMQTSVLKMDSARAYYWDYSKNYWCYKSTDATTGQTKDTRVTTFSIAPGEGFLCRFPTAGVGLEITVPAICKK